MKYLNILPSLGLARTSPALQDIDGKDRKKKKTSPLLS